MGGFSRQRRCETTLPFSMPWRFLELEKTVEQPDCFNIMATLTLVQSTS
jgi:hypothetical protein